MHELDRIAHALKNNRLNPEVFERCATDILSELYPGLSPISGGTDWGRDADIATVSQDVPVRVLVTTSRTFENVKKNLVSGLKSLKDHGKPVERVVLANPALLNQQQRDKLETKAREWGVTIDAIHDRDFFASKLRRDGEWRKGLLGLSSEPIALTRTPADLAEAPWMQVPLIGRDHELGLLTENPAEDIVIGGRPGVGKTRLVAAVDGLVFVDQDADEGRLADDLRWLRPARVAVDDAGQHLQLLGRLVRLRHSESDLLQYKIVAICWPDEVDKVRDRLRPAKEVQVDLLERRLVDQIITAMGVTSTIARQQILDQAEGRPGWAVALVEILTKTQKWESIFDGRVLLGEVERYIRRAQVDSDAIDVLTAVAALGGIADSQIERLAKTLDLSAASVRKLLLSSAHSGLVDVSDLPFGQGERIYNVRPPLLADVLVAEHAFKSHVPVVKLGELAVDWPEKLPQLAGSAINTALLGVASATAVAEHLLGKVLEDGSASLDQRRGLVRLYAQIDDQAGRQVLGWIVENFEALGADAVTGSQVEPLVVIASLLVRRYSFTEGVRLLLDAAMLDARATNSNPNHPLREIEDLVTQFHPELKPQEELRRLILAEADRWIIDRQDSSRSWAVFSAVVSSVLSLQRRGSHANPADWRELILVDTVLSPDEMQSVYDEIWPVLGSRLASAPPNAIKAAIDAASGWLRIGGGHDQPYGQDHPSDSIEKAAELGRKLINDLGALASGEPGLIMAIRNVIKWHDIELDLELDLDPTYNLFLGDRDRRGDRAGAMRDEQQAIEATVASWAGESPATVVARLAAIKSQAGIAGRAWPNRIILACSELARVVDPGTLKTWIGESLANGLFPEAGPFVVAAVAGGNPLPRTIVESCLAEPSARWQTLRAVISNELVASELLELSLASLMPSDYGLMESLFFDDSTPVAHRRILLGHENQAMCGAAAMAMFEAGHLDDGWSPGELESEWLAALKSFDPTSIVELQVHNLLALFKYMASKYPSDLYALLERQFELALNEPGYSPSYGVISGLYLLTPAFKTQMMERFGQSQLRWALLMRMPGTDVEWMEQMLDAGLMTPREALRSKDGFGQLAPGIPDLAKLLVPRGVGPEEIASLAQFGTHWGEQSSYFAKLVEAFRTHAESDDASVSTVGRAGVKIFGKARDEAAEKERVRRIRGDR